MKDHLIDQLSYEYEAAKDLLAAILPRDTTSDQKKALLYGKLQQMRNVAIKLGDSGDRFFAKVTATYVPKNKLCDEIAHLASVKDGKIIESKEHLNEFLTNFKEHVALANQHHPRCKPVELTIYQPGDSDPVFMVYVSSVFHMNIWREVHHA